jgi:co-chaperonin GroES (HSP10)
MATRIQEIKKKIALLSAELHNEFHPDYGNWYPKFPWVLVYVLPREQRIGCLWVPDDAKHQNKVTLEGVVVKIWKADHLPIKTELKIGDHVLFPHSAGQPFANVSSNEFKVIKEYIPNYRHETNDFIDNGHIFTTLTYTDKTIDKELEKEIHRLKKVCKTDKELLEGLRRNFVIYPNHSRTLSGV